VDDRLRRRLPVVVFDAAEKIVFVQVVGELQRGNVLPLLVAAQFVDDEDVRAAELIQLPDECAANETCSAGDDNHADSLNPYRNL
jgi:hypothetical protein